MLEIESLSVSYGGVQVLNDVCLTVGAGEIVAVLGANGAGKTTTLKAISGLVRPSGGRIRFNGSAISTFLRTRSLQVASPRCRRGGGFSRS